MDLVENARREKRQAFFAALGIALAVMILAPPIVQAAAQAVRITKSIPLPLKKGTTVKISNQGATVGTQPLGAPDLGESMPKTLATSIYAGGDGFHGGGVCGSPDMTPDTATDQDETVPAADPGKPDNVVTGVILSGPVDDPAAPNPSAPAVMTVKAPALFGNNAIITIRNSAAEPTKVLELPSGLRVSPSELKFECVAGGNLAAGKFAQFVILGH